MPSRDEQEYEGRRRQIIDGALHVFASKGFEKATNKDIADAAGIGSPGLIYHYFKDKADLLRQVLESRAEVLRTLAHGDDLLDRPPREVLPMLGRAFVQATSTPGTVPLMRVMMGEAMRRPAVAALVNSIGPGPAMDFFTRYFARQVELGNLRPIDPRAAARLLFGPLLAHLITREVFAQPDAIALPSETMVATTIEVFLAGLEPTSAPPDGSSGA